MESYNLAYVIGNLFGRLVMSAILVWIVFFLFSKFDWRAALKKTRSWYGILLIAVLFVLGVASNAARSGLV